MFAAMKKELQLICLVHHPAGVGLAPGLAFGAQAEGYVRLCYAQDVAMLEEAFDRFEKGYRQAIKTSH